mmetsp:Transcript_28991/g.43128  ORF Transcript_28991/g.43128 Transcript_28991/m.43128 type:complete len:482 (-) Transcript_28991:61-1506(-)
MTEYVEREKSMSALQPTSTATATTTTTSRVRDDANASLSSISSSSCMKNNLKYYYMPPEWHPHRATLILYPHNENTFRSVYSKCDMARREICNVARAIACWCTNNDDNNNNKNDATERIAEDVFLFCSTKEEALELENELSLLDETNSGSSSRGNIIVQVCKSDDTWIRDTGPTFIISTRGQQQQQAMIGLDWNFNAYGGPKEGCYWPCHNDLQIASTVIQTLQDYYSTSSNPCTEIQHQKVDIILEGGSIQTDGEGTILTTSECLLHPNRNPSKTQQEIESILLQHLVTLNDDDNDKTGKVLWLPKGLAYDQDTNGHIDNFCCFVKPAQVVLAWCDESNKELDHENYKRCRQALEFLERATDAKGRKIKVWKLSLPPPMFYTKEDIQSLQLINNYNSSDGSDEDIPGRSLGERMAASYVNFYISNNAIVVPQFGHTQSDENAIKLLQEIYPDRNVVGVFSRDILVGGGNIHCVTQQLPLL